MRGIFRLGGLVAAVVLIGFGIATIVMALNARSTVHTNLKQEKITGTPDMTPSAIKGAAQKAGLDIATINLPSCTVANEPVTDGSRARCFATYMRIHALEASGGLTYSEMPRYATANGKGTNDEAAAVKSPQTGKPEDNAARNVWVTETGLSTALNTSYMAEQLGLFALIIGIALLLSGIGFGVLLLGLVSLPQPTAPPPVSSA